jgi:hypothetical protein
MRGKRIREVFWAALAVGLLTALCSAAFGDEAAINSQKTYTLRVAALSVKGPLPDELDFAKASQRSPSAKMRPFPQVADTSAFLAAIRQYWPDLNFEPIVAGAMTLPEGDTVEAEFGGMRSGEWFLKLQGKLMPEYPADKPNRSALFEQYLGLDYRGGSSRTSVTTLSPVCSVSMSAPGPNPKPEDYTGQVIVSILQEGRAWPETPEPPRPAPALAPASK